MLIEGWMGTEEGGLVKSFACDFSKWTNERLRRELIFHENDRGTENVAEKYPVSRRVGTKRLQQGVPRVSLLGRC